MTPTTPAAPAATQYKVRGPDGVEHVIEGPEGASDDEIISQAQQLLGAKESPSPSHGATGTWAEDTKTQQLQADHPLLTFPLTAIAKIGKGAVDAASGLVNSVRPTEEDRASGYKLPVLPPGVIAKRALVDPHIAEAGKVRAPDPNASNFNRTLDAVESTGHTIAAAFPLVGPFVSHLTERTVGNENQAAEPLEALGEGLFGVGLGGVIEAARGKSSLTPIQRTMSERQIAAFASRIKSGVGERSVNTVAETAIPIFQKAASELGTTLETPLEGRFPTRSYGREAARKTVRTAGEHAIEIADHAVNISDRPFTEVLRAHGDATTTRAQFGEVKTPQVQSAIISKLETLAAENDNINQPLADAIRATADRVRSHGDTFNGLNDLKVLANKKSAPIFDRSMGAQLNASADVAYAWKALGDVIRSEMYPELSRISGVDLRNAGAVEASVMDARDGLRHNYYKEVLPAHAQRMAMTYFEYMRHGSLYHHNFISRALGLKETPAGEFNGMFRRGLGTPPPMPGSVPYYLGKGPTPETVAGVQNDLLPTGAVGTEPLLAPPPGTSAGIGESIFRVQQRADQAARRAPPPTIAGEQVGGLLPIEGNAPPPMHYVTDAHGKILESHALQAPTRDLFSDQYGAKGTYPDAVTEYMQDLHQRQLWRGGEPKLAKGQLDFNSQIPPDIYGVKQVFTDAIPEGTKLEFSSARKGGASKEFHYVTPDGRRFITDFEISPSKLKPPKEPGPTEPGTHWAGQGGLFLQPPPHLQ